MSKKAYYKCEGCELTFSSELLQMNDDLELTCEECLEEAKRNRQSYKFLILGCAFMASGIIFLIIKLCSK